MHQIPNKNLFKQQDIYKLSQNKKVNLDKKAKIQRAFDWRKSILFSNEWNFTPKEAGKFHGGAKELKQINEYCL